MNRSFPGKVARFSDKLQLATRTMETEVDVPNPSLLLIPGMYAEVDLTMEKRVNALAVPVTAVDRDSDSVMAVGPEQRLELRKVTLGIETADEVEVHSGLREGDFVVIGNRSGLRGGQQVKPIITTIGGAKEGQ